MMAAVALSLCFVLVCVLLYRDCGRSPGLSRGLWVPVIWVMYAGSRLLSAWGPRSDQMDAADKLRSFAEGNPLDRNFQLLLLFIGSVVLIRRQLDWKPILRDNRALVLFIMFCGLSVTWSDSPLIAFRRWIKIALPLVAALIIFTERDPLHALTTVFRRCAYVLLPFSLVLIMYLPQYGIDRYVSGLEQEEYTYCGVTAHRNMLGRLSMISCLFLLASIHLLWRTPQRRRWLEVGILVGFVTLSLYLLHKANSATSNVCLFVGVVTYLALGTGLRKHTGRVVAVTLLFFALYFVAELSVGVFDRVVVLLGRDPSLTGRIELWADVLSMDTNPFIGVGFNSFWDGERATILWEKYSLHQAHNGFLEIYLQLGIIGVALVLSVIFAAYRKGLRTLSFEPLAGRCALSLLAVVVLNNLTTPAFDRPRVMFLLLVVAGAFPARALAGQRQEKATPNEVRQPPIVEGPRRILPRPTARRRSPALRPKRVLQ